MKKIWQNQKLKNCKEFMQVRGIIGKPLMNGTLEVILKILN